MDEAGASKLPLAKMPAPRALPYHDVVSMFNNETFCYWQLVVLGLLPFI